MDRLFVPIVNIDIKPHPNAERPAIEKTNRVCMAPVYEVAIYRAKWGREAEHVTTKPLSAHLNPYRELIAHHGLDPVQAEKARLIRNHKETAFYRAYPTDEDFRAAVMKDAATENPWLTQRAAETVELEERATEKAAEAVQKVAKAALVKAELKRGPGRPRKVQPEPTA